MADRINALQENQDGMNALVSLEKAVVKSGIDRKLYHLIKIRASQLNGCAYCLNMHTRDARKLGETEQRIDVVAGWKEALDLYTPKERAAFALTEAITTIADTRAISDSTYDEAAKYFDKKQLAGLIMGIVAINSWNRIAVACQLELD